MKKKIVIEKATKVSERKRHRCLDISESPCFGSGSVLLWNLGRCKESFPVDVKPGCSCAWQNVAEMRTLCSH